MNFDRTIFRIIASSLAVNLCETVAIAAARAGHCGLLNLEYTDLARPAARRRLARLADKAGGPWGISIRTSQARALCDGLGDLLSGAALVVLADDGAPIDARQCAELRQVAQRAEVFVSLTDADGLAAAEAAGVDGIIAKGNEAGGAVGDETGFLLVQRLVAATRLPVIAQGGVGLHTAAAYKVAGAAGVLLDWQLALFPQACVPEAMSRAVARMDGSETRVVGADLGQAHRVFWRADHKPSQVLHKMEQADAAPDAFQQAVQEAVTCEKPDASLWLMGQDAGFARGFAAAYRSVGEALAALSRKAEALIETAQTLKPLSEGSPLAAANGTRYPILQGPMTRVSDVPGFALAVAEGGALPFLALALMRQPQADALLAETKAKLVDRPWGVGILGFVDEALRAEQTAVITAHNPRFALIAGGRPDQAVALEEQGIATYLHVPSPGLVSLFLESGARRFVFEGRECGGHVGPRTSAILWQQAVDAVLAHFGPEGPIDCELIFAGGVHDGVSGAMVSALSAELAARGARIGVIVGTGYILTQEAVATGAVLENYQRLALTGDRTVLLESAPGHATRVVHSPVVDEFLSEKRRMNADGIDPDEVHDRLEAFNVGRSRIAAKGIDRNPHFGKRDGAEEFLRVDHKVQMAHGLFMIGQAAGLHRTPTTIADLHGAISGGASDLLDKAVPMAKTGDVVGEGTGARIAITGIGTILPGASDFPSYWENILDKHDAIEEVPERRWDWRRYYDEDRDAPDKAYSKWGGFVDEIEFDPIRYGIPPNSVPSIEPLQLLALEVVRQALEDAGFKDGVIDDPELRQRTSVIIGVGGGTGPLGQCYAVRSSMPAVNGALTQTADDRLPDWTEDSFPGILLNVIAGRVANRFDLGGVNFTVDAACGSSLAAVNAAVREIETGGSDMAIVGGVDSFQNPFDFVAFSKTRALSPRGKCRTFDADADGIAISDGLAVMVMRKLDDAEAAGDRIYAVLRGVAGSSDGRDLSLTAPRPEGQQSALRRAYARAGISPSTVGLIEAHGTGTVVGDRTEIQSLTKAFSVEGDETQFCGVGSVKSMIGHTKAAAGSAGLVKAAMALHSKVLPATLNIETPNTGVDFSTSPFYLMTEARPWLRRGGTPRRAGVSAFGFGGTNFHAVLEEYEGGYLPHHQAPLRRNWTHELFLFSADDQQALQAELRRTATAMADAPEGLRGADVAASLAQVFDPKAGARFALVAASLDEAAERLARTADTLAEAAPDLSQTDPLGAYFSGEAPIDPDQLAFLFPGQGSQYPNMAADLVMLFPDMRETIEHAAQVLEGKTPGALDTLIYPRPTLDEAEAADQAEALKRTDAAQPAIGAVSLAMLGLLDEFGLTPSAVAGHSFGEYSALHAAGAFDADTFLSLAHARGDAMIREGGDDLGTMAAVGASPDDIAQVIGTDSGVTNANRNAPDQTVIAGPTPAVEQASQVLSSAGLSVTQLPVACGFHSECVAGAGARLAGALGAADIGAPGLPVYANATAAPYAADGQQVRDQLVSHLVDPVNFQGAVEAMHDAGARLFIEVGPGAVLSNLTGRILQDRPHLAVPTDKKGRAGAQQLLSALAAAAVAGLNLSLDRIWAGRTDHDVDVKGWVLERPEGSKSASLWMVDAAKARPKGKPPLRIGMSARIEDDPAPQPIAAPAPQPHMDAPMPTPQAPSHARTDMEEALRRHQELMATFLENNRAVMMAFLQGGGDAGAMPNLPVPAAAAQAPVSPPVSAPAPAAAPVAEHPTPAPEPVAEAPASGGDVSEARVRNLLLDLIADRTGYPPEMLEGDLNLEADLGIDSIKRVEILGALRAEILPWTGEEAKAKMGPVSREKTVPGIVAQFMAVVAEYTAPADSAPQPEAAPEAVDLSETRVRNLLLDLIADRTGYPPEMLEGDLNLEADLGIDSIKRVEILGALRAEILPWTGEDAKTRMGPVSREKTVPGIVAQFMQVVAEFAAPGAPASAAADAEPPQDADGDLPEFTDWPARFRMVPREVATPVGQDWVQAGARYAITRDGGGVAEALARRIEAAGGVPVLLDGAQPMVHGDLAGIFHCAPLSVAQALAGQNAKDWQADVDAATRDLFLLLSGVGAVLASREDAVVLCATAMGGSFGFGDAPTAPAAGGAPGLLKTLAKEWTAVHCRAVDFEAGADAEAMAETLFAEAGRQDGLVEIGHQGGARLGLFAQAEPVDPAKMPDLTEQSTVLVTGGARGITAKIVKRLARDHACRFVLVGAAPEPPQEAPEIAGVTDTKALKSALIAAAKEAGRAITPAAIEGEYSAILKAREITATLEEITAAGAKVEYIPCDVRDADAFGAVIADIYARHGRIDGVLHGAGVIEDKLIADKSPDSFDRVIGTKTESALTLTQALDGDSLKFLVFFTSVAGRFGNRGQGDYGAANETVAKLAGHLNAQWPGRVLAVSWGPWDSGGMVSDEVKAQFAEMGIEPIPPALGVEALAYEITQPGEAPAEIVWGRGPWQHDGEAFETLYAKENAPEAAQ